MLPRAMPPLLLPLLLLAALAAALPAAPAGAQARTGPATMKVRFVDDSTGHPLPGAHVQVGDRLGAFADSSGVARVSGIPAGNLVVSFGRLGYGTERALVEFQAGAEVETDVRLTPEPVSLQPLDVTAAGRDPSLARIGFYQRQALKAGTFLAGERLANAARSSNRLTDALLDVPGIRITGNGRPLRYGLVIASARGAVSMRLGCLPPVYVDGVKVDYLTGSIDPDVNAIVPLNDVLGIEVYPEASLSPMEYDRSPCGLVIIWTKRRQQPGY